MKSEDNQEIESTDCLFETQGKAHSFIKRVSPPLALHSLTPLTPFLKREKKKCRRYKLKHQNRSAENSKYSYCKDNIIVQFI